MMCFKMGLNTALHSSPQKSDGLVGGSGLHAEDEEDRQPRLTLRPG